MEKKPKEKKGLLAPFKKEDGTFQKWAYVLFVIAALVMIRDVFVLINLNNTDPVRAKEIDMIMMELQTFGNSYLETEGENVTLSDSEYQYQYDGARVMHQFLVDSKLSYEQMEQEFEDIKERSFDVIELSDLNDPQVVEEVRVSYQKQREVLKRTNERSIVILDNVAKELTVLKDKYSDDSFIKGAYEGFVENQPRTRVLMDEIMLYTNDMCDSADAYLEFLLVNKGKYEFGADGTFNANPGLQAEYLELVDAIQESVADLNDATAKYTENLSSKMADLDAMIGK